MVDSVSDESLIENSEKVSGMGIATLIANLIVAPFFGLGNYLIYNEAYNDSYISAIIGIILSILPLTILIFINKKSEGKSILDLNISLFGKVLGNVLNVILNLTYFFAAVIVFYNISSFFSLSYLPDTSKMYIDILLLIAIAYASTKSISVISKMSQIIFLINLIFFFACQIGIFNEYEVDRIYPIMKNGINPVVRGSLIFFITMSFPMFLVSIIPSYEIHSGKDTIKKISILWLIAGLCMLAIIFSTIIIMGENTLTIYRYPEYEALKTFSLFSIVERIEDTLSLQFMFSMAIFMVMCFHFIIRSLKKIFEKNQSENLFPYILSIAIFLISNFLFKNVTESFDKILPYFLKIVGIGIFIPMLITTIGLIIREISRKNKLKSA